jgi:Uroporphyrinogen decarboxylase (URO-D)
MNSRERVEAALAHVEPDRVPLDLGASPTSGMQVSVVYALRQALELDAPGTPVKVVEPYQMLGEIAPDLADALGVDITWLPGPKNMFGFANQDWKPWTTFDGTPVLVPELFNTEPDAQGQILMYPQGDRSARASGRMPRGGFYFDSIVRQDEIDDEKLDPADNVDYGPLSEEDLAWFERESKRLRGETDRAILGGIGGTALGDIALVPGPWIRDPEGIRDVEEWYVSTALRADYVREIFERQTEIALANLELYRQAVGDSISVIFMCGTDFGTQNGPFISPDTFRDLYKPCYRKMNDWVHANTGWKTFKHTCGGILPLVDELIEAGFDILNPVQCSAADMEASELKQKFGSRVTFWGGGVDTQKTLPFGTPEEVRAEVKERINTFSPGGGFVFNTIHNVQVGTPTKNVTALYEAVREFASHT